MMPRTIAISVWVNPRRFFSSSETNKWSPFFFIFCSVLFLVVSTLLLVWGIYDEFYEENSSHQDLKNFLLGMLAKLMWSFYWIGIMSLFLLTYQFFFAKTQIKRVKNWLLKYKMRLKMFYEIQIIICFTLNMIKFSFWDNYMEYCTLIFFLAYLIHFLSLMIYFGVWYQGNNCLMINTKISKCYRRHSIFYNTKNNEKIIEFF